MEGMKRIDRVLKYEGAILDVYDDVMESPTGHIAHWDFVRHRKGASALVAVTDEGRILVVRQYRSAVDRETLEIPAGCRNSEQEAWIDCAARELEEEIGYRAEHITPLVTVASAVGYSSEIVEVFLATGLTKGTRKWDEDEFIETESFQPEELKERILAGQIQDSKTIAGVLAYLASREEGREDPAKNRGKSLDNLSDSSIIKTVGTRSAVPNLKREGRE